MAQEQALDINTMDDAALLEAIDAGMFSNTSEEGPNDTSTDSGDSDTASDDIDQVVADDHSEEFDEEVVDKDSDDGLEQGESDVPMDEDDDPELDTPLEEDSVSDDDEDTDDEDGEEDLEEEDVPKETPEEVYERLFQPFKAANQMVQINSVDEAIKLMQQGVDYYKKTRELAKYSRTVHMLEKNGLTSDEDIGYIIDLFNKDPKAISKLLKDSNIDVMELDLDEESDYTPSNHTISDKELELRMVMTRNADNRDFQSIVDDVRDWDVDSRKLVSDHPQLLEILSEDYASGAYQQVMAEITKREALGQLVGLSKIQAYRQVVEEWTAPQQKRGKPSSKSNPQPKANDSDRQRRRKAASPAPRSVAKPKKAEINTPQELYAMSDEELDKLLNL